MRKILPALVIAVFVAGAVAQSGRKNLKPPPPPPPEQLSEPPIVVDRPAPERNTSAPLTALPESIRTRKLTALDNSSFSLADFSDKVLVLNIWASWCGPCRREVPEYEKVRKEFSGRAVEFIGLTAEDPATAAEKVKRFARETNFGFRLAWADRQTAVTLMNGRGAIPQTLVVAPDGHIISHWSGYSSGQGGKRLREILENALSKDSGQ